MAGPFALRSAAVTFRGDPFLEDPHRCLVYLPDALIVIEDGLITAFGDAAQLGPSLPSSVPVTEWPGSLISAGFVDAHVHYPQTQMIAACGEQLLAWLNRYTFVAEQQFAERAHCDRVAAFFLRELLRSGTTTAAVYCTVHAQSVDAFFEESARFNTRMIAGKVLMDRNAPSALLDSVDSGYQDSLELIRRWHGRGRQLYCVTPRFAGSCSEAQLEMSGALLHEHDDLLLQTHLCENRDEVRWVESLFPHRAGYLDIYAKAGLLGPRSIFGHGIFLGEEDFLACHQAGAALAHCPTSNLFLGSGLFRLFDARDPRRPVRVGLGSDVGAGTSFCALQSLNEAYKVAALNGTCLNAIQAFYLATRGGAEALYLEDRIGSIGVGHEADLVVLDLRATPLLRFRMEFCADIEEQLFALMMLGDDRVIRATYVAGERVYDRDRAEPFAPPS